MPAYLWKLPSRLRARLNKMTRARFTRNSAPCAILAGLFFLLAWNPPAHGCRYSVREVGFVDLDRAPYRFFVYMHDGEDGGLAEKLRAAAMRHFHSANLELVMTTASEARGSDAGAYLPEQLPESGWSGVLVSPDNRPLPVTISGSPEDWEDVFAGLALSPVREAIRKEIVEAYCVALLIHGEDDAENTRAEDVLGEAVSRMSENLVSVEKPTEVPPKMLRISQGQRADERVLIFALGMDPDSVTHPGIALLFGRARRIGAVLRGDRVDSDELLRLMMLVGASCECGLDRGWMQGPMIPLRWDRESRDRLAKHLGFDPESPLVRMEMSQILSQGSEVAKVSADDPFMGYREFGTTTTRAPEPDNTVSAAESPETSLPAVPETQPAQVSIPEPQTPSPPVAATSGNRFPIVAVVCVIVAINVVIAAIYLLRKRRELT